MQNKEMITAMSTVKAAERPIASRNGIPVIVKPESAMITVMPAKTTALPAVAYGMAAVSMRSMPCRRFCRYRERINNP